MMPRWLAGGGLLALLNPAAPAPGLLRTKQGARQLDCQPVDDYRGVHTHPGVIEPPPPRGSFGEHNTVVCAERWLRAGLRSPHTEAILSSLDTSTRALAARAGDEHPHLAQRTWLVEAHHFDTQVAAKLRFATQAALIDAGRPVSDRVPIWTPSDISVLTRLPPERAYAAACKRAHDSGQLSDNDVLMSVLVLDPRETILHAGVCTRGHWAWLQ